MLLWGKLPSRGVDPPTAAVPPPGVVIVVVLVLMYEDGDDEVKVGRRKVCVAPFIRRSLLNNGLLALIRQVTIKVLKLTLHQTTEQQCR